MMAAKNDAGVNKGVFVLLKRIERISELVHGFFYAMMHRIAAGTAQADLCSPDSWLIINRVVLGLRGSATVSP